MKKIVIFSLLVLPVFLFSQEWFKEGDQWIHQIPYGYFGGVSGFEAITVKGDTILNGENYKTLEGVKALNVVAGDTLFKKSPNYFLRESNDSVYHFYNGVEYLIYDFTMEVGDSIKWYSDENDQSCPWIFTLDSIFTTMVDGSEVIVQQGIVKKEYALTPRGLRIYKGIGVVESKFNIDGATWIDFGFLLPRHGLTCYADYSPPYLCNFIRDTLSLKGSNDYCNRISSSTHHWISLGRKWVYTLGGGISPSTFARVLEFKYPSDTMINEIQFYKLSNNVFSLNGENELVSMPQEPYLLREEDRKLFYWTGDTTHLVYDFNMRIGDTLEYHPQITDEIPDSENCRSYFVLDSVRIDSSSGPPFQVQMGRIQSDFWGSFSFVEIYESIGIVRRLDTFNNVWLPGNFLIPELDMGCFICDCDGQGQFCSYESEFGLRFPTELDDESCFDLVSSTSSISFANPKIRLLQNPVQDLLFLEGDISNFDNYKIYTVNGRLLLNGNISTETIDIQNLQLGYYIIVFNGHNTTPISHKFIKI